MFSRLIRECPDAQMVPEFKKYMIKKWTALGEERFIKAFMKPWEQRNWDRISANQHHPLAKGGTPADNGSLESGNNWWKNELDRRVVPSANMLQAACGVLKDMSLRDLSFGKTYNRKASNTRAFSRAMKMAADPDGNICPLQVDLADGVHPEPGCLKYVRANARIRGTDPVDLKSQLHIDTVFKNRGQMGKKLLQAYTALHDDPAKQLHSMRRGTGITNLTDREYELDEARFVLESFFKLTPITDVKYARYVRQLLLNDHIPVVAESVLDAATANGTGFSQCSCGWHLHYSLCDHVLADALKKKLIAVPATRDGRMLADRNVQKNKHATPGGALTRHEFTKQKKKKKKKKKQQQQQTMTMTC